MFGYFKQFLKIQIISSDILKLSNIEDQNGRFYFN